MKNFFILLIFILISQSGSAQGFTEIAESIGVDYDFKTDEYGGGVSFVDFNQDGLDDLTFTTGPNESIRFHLNTGNGFTELETLVDNTTETKQALWVDFNNDGELDLFVASSNQNRLYKNNGDLQLEDVTTSLGLPETDQLTFAANWMDYNRDGWVDLFVTYRTEEETGWIELYRNNQGTGFEDMTAKSGLLNKGNSVLTMTSFDYNNDGWTDLFLAQDWEQGNQLLENTGNGTFKDVSLASNTNQKMNSMTATAADFNEDGWFDIYVSNTMEGTILLQNNQDGTFTDVAEEMGIKIRSLTFGSIFFDADNDSDLDIHIVGGQVNYMYENPGNGLPFERVNDEWGFEKDRFFNNGFATGDHNGDGYIDLVKNSMTLSGTQAGVHTFWENNFTSNNYLSIDLEGTISNKSAIGSIVNVHLGDRVLKRRIACGESFCSQLSYTQFFGTGSLETVDKVVVEWPSGNITEIINVESNQRLKLTEPTSGCTSSSACNYSPTATTDNGFCQFPEVYYDCSGCLNDQDQDGVCDELEISGCMDIGSCSFNPDATDDDGSCTYLTTYEIVGNTSVEPMIIEEYSYPASENSQLSWEAENGAIVIGHGLSKVQVIWYEDLPWILNVTETDENKCVSETVSLEVNMTVLSRDKLQDQGYSIYPNPATSEIRVTSDYAKSNAVNVYINDIQGKQVIATQLSSLNEIIDIRELDNGIYLVRISWDTNSVVRKLLINR